MPLNTLRLNHAPSSHPNDRIVFIKPLPRPPPQASDYETADVLLRAIAAQCLPIMKSHYLSVTTLEEHEPNPEFIGRNFNNGEIIQLVLRSKSGGWLPVNMIQMVMMHELAHNMHMNHGRDFWKTRNMFAEEMRALWARGYTGDGLWGSGRTLRELGDVMSGNVVRSDELKDLPLCGGTYRSRRRKRKAAGKNDGLTWKEKQQQRIEKKFGKNGMSLGEDEDKRLSLELSGKGPVGVKPRVAQSKRGRELRAAAALARFDTNKKETEELDRIKREDQDTQSEDEDDYEDSDVGFDDARDTDGTALRDSHGHGMVKVCGGEDGDDVFVKQEMQELEGLDFSTYDGSHGEGKSNKVLSRSNESQNDQSEPKSLYDIPEHDDKISRPSDGLDNITKSKPTITIDSSNNSKPKSTQSATTSSSSSPRHDRDTSHTQPAPNIVSTAITSTDTTTNSCPVCSLANQRSNVTCLACAHVLDRRKDPLSWQCESGSCKDTGYVNAGDVGVCGICGGRKAT